PAALAIADRLGPPGTGLGSSAQTAFVDGLGLAMVIAAASVAVAAVFVLWRAPREAVKSQPASESDAGPQTAAA
ncbi:MAG: hypothetical protein WBV53_00335, partial [Solirubrobacterales bacterium]